MTLVYQTVYFNFLLVHQKKNLTVNQVMNTINLHNSNNKLIISQQLLISVLRQTIIKSLRVDLI